MTSHARAATTLMAGAGQFGVHGNVAWVQIPVAHLAFETDIHFSIIHRSSPTV